MHADRCRVWRSTRSILKNADWAPFETAATQSSFHCLLETSAVGPDGGSCASSSGRVSHCAITRVHTCVRLALSLLFLAVNKRRKPSA